MFLLTLASDDPPHPRELRPGTTVVGRAAECDIVINDDSMSRRHAQFIVEEGRVRVVDLRSSNGVYVNGERVQEAAVRPGDALKFGAVVASLLERPDERKVPVPVPAPVAAGLDLGQTIYRRVDVNVPQAATAVDADRLMRLLSGIGRALVASLSLDETLDRVVALLLDHVPADRARLLMRSPEGGDFTARVTRRKAGSTAPSEFTVSRTVIDLVLRERVAVLTSDVTGDARFDASQSLVRSDIRSLMCAPLLADTAIIGLLYVDNSLHRQFSVADLELFTALADYASVAISQARLGDELAREGRRRERLSRYHSPAVVERVLQDEGSAEAIVGQERDVSILFADLVQFTTMTETMSPNDVVTLLCRFFSRMTEAVFAQEGTVDKFIGDAILAVFGAPIGHADHARRAILTAQQMLAAVRELNELHVAPRPLAIRVAINSGTAIVGDVGSPQRLEYTVVGDVVNTAARLQSEVAKPNDIVVSRATLDRAGMALNVEAIGEVRVRGRAASVEAFRLLSDA